MNYIVEYAKRGNRTNEQEEEKERSCSTTQTKMKRDYYKSKESGRYRDDIGSGSSVIYYRCKTIALRGGYQK